MAESPPKSEEKRSLADTTLIEGFRFFQTEEANNPAVVAYYRFFRNSASGNVPSEQPAEH